MQKILTFTRYSPSSAVAIRSERLDKRQNCLTGISVKLTAGGMRKFKYSLQKGSKKYTCPACGNHKSFVPYVDEAGDIVDVEKFGRCERINNCGYISYPKIKGEKESTYVYKPLIYVKPPEPDFIKREMVEKTFTLFNENTFFMYLVKMFGRESAFDLQAKYNIGTAKNGGTIFWQQDKEGRFRTGKVMYYNETGRRDKLKTSWYLHKKVKDNFNLMQVFFGEHLDNGDKPVAVCESEKTAIMMSVFEPTFTWVATGGSEMINGYRKSRLSNIGMVFPDSGQFKKWMLNTGVPREKMDERVEIAVKNGMLPAGADILDLYLINN